MLARPAPIKPICMSRNPAATNLSSTGTIPTPATPASIKPPLMSGIDEAAAKCFSQIFDILSGHYLVVFLANLFSGRCMVLSKFNERGGVGCSTLVDFGRTCRGNVWTGHRRCHHFKVCVEREITGLEMGPTEALRSGIGFYDVCLVVACDFRFSHFIL